MYERGKITDLDDFFKSISKRASKNTYVYRLFVTDAKTNEFLAKFISAARCNGLLLDGGLKNPDISNVQYCQNILGKDFKLAPAFFQSKLKTLINQLDSARVQNIGNLLYDYFFELSRTGKPEQVLYNLYIKFMCWFYGKCSMMLSNLGRDTTPKILVWDKTSKHEIVFLDFLAKMGADIVYVFPKGDFAYLQLDKESAYSDLYKPINATTFKENLTLREVIENITFGGAVDMSMKTNALSNLNSWVEDNVFNFNSALTDFSLRNAPKGGFSNIFFVQYGVEDKYSFSSSLLDFYKKLVDKQRKIVIINDFIPCATNDEIASVTRGNYANAQQLIAGLAKNISFSKRKDLEELMKNAFAEVLHEEAKPSLDNVQKLNNIAVGLICWIKRYVPVLLSELSLPQCATFIFFSKVKPKIAEKVFLAFLAKLPIDVICFFPNTTFDYELSSKAHKVIFEYTDNMEQFPADRGGISVKTFAGKAEEEIDSIIGIEGSYRNQQFKRAKIERLSCSSYEINSLWDQDLRFRPNFSDSNNEVYIPAIFAKLNGVEGGESKLNDYWFSIKERLTPDTTLVTAYPWIPASIGKVIAGVATRYIDKRGKLAINAIKNSSDYKYGFLNIDKQDFLLDKIQNFLDRQMIEGVGKNGLEYSVLGILLDLPDDILRSLQKFDFTKKNPKYIFVVADRYIFSLEETVVANFLHFLGFDVLIYTPTGFECFGPCLAKREYDSFTLGDFLFGCQVPDISKVERSAVKKLKSLIDIIRQHSR